MLPAVALQSACFTSHLLLIRDLVNPKTCAVHSFKQPDDEGKTVRAKAVRILDVVLYSMLV